MKENWIEKLIKLLNEYERETVNDKEFFGYTEEIVNLRKEYLISKSFGFIKWLVNNDKIEIHKIDTIMIKSNRQYKWIDKTTKQRVDDNMENVLLMLLSIQDNPIEFLVSILK